MSGRVRVIAAGAGLAALLAVPTAAAKVYFSGVPESAPPGTRVKAHVMGCEAAPACRQTVRGISVYLARLGTRPASSDVPPRPRWLVGKATGKGRLTFTVPNVRSGHYLLVARLAFGGKPQYLTASNVFWITPWPTLFRLRCERDVYDATQRGSDRVASFQSRGMRIARGY